RFTAADAAHKLAILAYRGGNATAAEPHFKMALDRHRELVSRFPRNPRFRLWKSVVQMSYACYLGSQGRDTEAASARQVAESDLTSFSESAVHPQLLELAHQFLASSATPTTAARHDP